MRQNSNDTPRPEAEILTATVLLLLACYSPSFGAVNESEPDFTSDVCAEIASNGTCNCTYIAKYDSASIDCGSTDGGTHLQISIYEKTDVEIFCTPSVETYPLLSTELLARVPLLGGMRKSMFLGVHHCVPFTELLARMQLTRGNILHVHGLGMLPVLEARHFGQNLSFLQTINDLELLAQPQTRSLAAAQQLDADLFTAFTSLWSLKIDLNFTQLPQNIFRPLTNKLSDLILYGGLLEFPRLALAPLERLNTLTMMRHQLADRLREDDFEALGLLELLTLHNCGISDLPARLFAPLPALKRLRLTSNYLRALPKSLFVPLIYLQTLDLSRNKLEMLPPGLFHPSAKLMRLTLSHNRLLKLSGNMLPALNTLIELSLNNNALRAIVPGSLAQAQRLEILVLDHNQLNWTNVEACDVLDGLRSLTTLQLYNNSLHNLCAHLSASNHTTSPLRLLDVRHNSIARLPPSLIRTINESTSMKELYLSHNPWACDCSAELLHAFVKHNRLRYRDMLDMRCEDPQLAPLAELSYRDFCPLDLGVSSIYVLAFMLLSALSLLAVSTALCYYKYKLQLQIWLYAHGLCLCCISENELDSNRKYDAFISYAHQDEHFVEHELLPGLENGTPPFKVCIHVRDWLAGVFISEQIIDSVEQSRRTIIVLSQHFIQSTWARMEFRMAQQRALNEGRTRLILVIYGDLVDLELLDQELSAYLKMNTYLKWGEPWFWEKLRYAMPHSRVASEREERSGGMRSDEIPLQAAMLSA